MKITKGTIIRTVMIIIVVLNLILKKCGINPLNIEEGSVEAFVETMTEAAVILVSFWKNNSFSQNAIRADEFLKELNSNVKGTEY